MQAEPATDAHTTPGSDLSAGAPQPVLSVRDIFKHYGGVQALSGVSLDLWPGKIHCLAGENGSGKSTLIKIISGVEQPDSGSIEVSGHHGHLMSPTAAIMAGIQVIYQDFSLFGNLSVRENIALLAEVAAHRHVFSSARTRAIANHIVTDLRLPLDLDAHVESLSVADKQLTAICRALVGDAKVIIMDEPTTALTSSEVARLFTIVRRLQARGVAMVFVSHKLEEVLEVADEVTIMRNGAVVARGSAKDFNQRTIEVAMTGHHIDDTRKVSSIDASAQVVLKAEHLGRTGVFDNVNFSLRCGEILGLTGLLGSGRSEIAEAIFGVAPPDTGTVWIRRDRRATSSTRRTGGVAEQDSGAQVSDESFDLVPCQIRRIRDAVEAGIGYVPPDRLTQGLFLTKSIADNMIASSLGMYRSRCGLLDSRRIHVTIAKLFERLHIKAPTVSVAVSSLSGGNAQRVVLAKWLALRPRVLILNGPTVGVDVGSKEEILSILREQASTGMGIIVISDDVPELVSICHRVLVVHHGRITQELQGDAITVPRILQEVSE